MSKKENAITADQVGIGVLVGTIHGLHNRGKIVEPFNDNRKNITEKDYEWYRENSYKGEPILYIQWEDGKRSIVPMPMIYVQKKCILCEWGTENPDRFDGMCFGCNFWMERVNERETLEGKYFALSKNVYYDYGEGCVPDRYNLYVVYEGISTAQHRGSGGRRMVFHFIDGRVVESNNVWSRGDVPAHFVHYFTPFLAEIK